MYPGGLAMTNRPGFGFQSRHNQRHDARDIASSRKTNERQYPHSTPPRKGIPAPDYNHLPSITHIENVASLTYITISELTITAIT